MKIKLSARSKHLFIVGFFLLNLAITQSAHASITSIWAIDDSEKIKQTVTGSNVRRDSNGTPLSTSSLSKIWNPNTKTVNLFGAKNEVIGFQVILEAGTAESGISVELPQLTHTNQSYVMKNDAASNGDPYNYVKKYIELFHVDYVPVTKAPDSTYEGSIPEVLTPAVPATILQNISIAAGENQSIWFDVTIDRAAPAGLYEGTIVIKKAGSVISQLSVRLQVYNFTLPDLTSLPNMFWFNPGSLNNRFSSSNKTTIENRYFMMAHRHRMDLVTTSSLETVQNRYKPFLNGQFYNESNGYDGPGKNTRHTTYSIGTYDLCKSPAEESCGNASGWPVTSGESAWRTAADQWYTYFKDPTNGLKDLKIFRYMIDEPYWPEADKPWATAELIKLAKWIHNNPGVGKNLPTFCTASIKDNPTLIGSCDIWSQTQNTINLPITKARQNLGEEAGIYNGLEPYYGQGIAFMNVNNTSARVVPWIIHKHGLDHYFLWEVTYRYDSGTNIFQDSYVVHGDGDGLLMYPGNDSRFPSESRGLDGPLANVRMKGWRRGVQDYEYIQLAIKAGKSAQVNEIVNDSVLRAFNETIGKQAPHWYTYGYQYEIKRQLLAELIAGSQPITPSSTYSSCAKKTQGDADCDGTINLIDFEIWRKEFMAHCKASQLSSCGTNDDNILTAMDADFNDLPEHTLNNEKGVTIIDFEIWRKSFL